MKEKTKQIVVLCNQTPTVFKHESCIKEKTKYYISAM